MSLFSDETVDLSKLRKKAFNFRWAVVDNEVIPLTAADPDFPVAESIQTAIKAYTNEGYFSYAPADGLPEFKEAVANWYLNEHQSIVNKLHVLPVNSAANGLYIIAKSLLTHKDEVLVPDPVDFLFRKSIENAGGKVVTCQIEQNTGNFQLDDLKSKITPSTKAMFICNPNNPLGKSISKEHLEELIAFCQQYDLWLVSDEIWIDIYYNKPLTSVFSKNIPRYAKSIVVSGLSKNFGLAGLRIGYIIAPNDATYQLILKNSDHQTTAGGIASLSQIAGIAALNSSKFWLEEFRIHLKKMKQLTEEFIDEMPFLERSNSDSTYVLFPKIIHYTKDANSLVELILKEAKVALVPGGENWFERSSEGHIRICFATSEAILNEAFSRIRAVQDKILAS